MQIAVLAFRTAFMSFDKRRHAERPTEGLTREANFTIKMVGSRNDPALKTKGAETYGLMKFFMFFIEAYSDRVGSDWQRILAAGQALDSIIGIWQKHSGSLTIPADDRKDSTMWETLIPSGTRASVGVVLNVSSG